MSEAKRITLIGATGLVGRKIMAAAVGRSELRLTALSRREYPLPKGARMEMCVAAPENWPGLITSIASQVLICALGTTWRKAGKDEEAFRAVDYDLVLRSAEAARASGASHMIVVSAVGAHIGSRSFYLRVKGQMEDRLIKLGFPRLDILQPSLLRGARDGDMRLMERAGQLVAPAANLALHGRYRRYRAVRAERVAEAALNLAMESRRGRYTYDYDDIMRWSARG